MEAGCTGGSLETHCDYQKSFVGFSVLVHSLGTGSQFTLLCEDTSSYPLDALSTDLAFSGWRGQQITQQNIPTHPISQPAHQHHLVLYTHGAIDH